MSSRGQAQRQQTLPHERVHEEIRTLESSPGLSRREQIDALTRFATSQLPRLSPIQDSRPQEIDSLRVVDRLFLLKPTAPCHICLVLQEVADRVAAAELLRAAEGPVPPPLPPPLLPLPVLDITLESGSASSSCAEARSYFVRCSQWLPTCDVHAQDSFRRVGSYVHLFLCPHK